MRPGGIIRETESAPLGGGQQHNAAIGGKPPAVNRPRRPLSRGFNQAGYPTEPLVSYRSYRQLPGWNLPPLVMRAFGAH